MELFISQGIDAEHLGLRVQYRSQHSLLQFIPLI